MFAKETYMQRRALLKKNLGSGVLLFLGNDECGLNYEDITSLLATNGVVHSRAQEIILRHWKRGENE